MHAHERYPRPWRTEPNGSDLTGTPRYSVVASNGESLASDFDADGAAMLCNAPDSAHEVHGVTKALETLSEMDHPHKPYSRESLAILAREALRALRAVQADSKLRLTSETHLAVRDVLARADDHIEHVPNSAAILSAFGVGRAMESAAAHAANLEASASACPHAALKAKAALRYADGHLASLPEDARATLTPHVARMRGKVAESFARAGVQL